MENNENLTDQQAHDIMTTALEGGYMEEFTVISVRRDDELNVVRLTATCPEQDEPVDGKYPVYVFDADAIRRGWALIVQQYGTSTSYLGQEVRTGLEDMATDPEMGTPGVMDAIGCDAVLQLAAWGEIIFG